MAPGAYICDEERLYEVLDRDGATVRLRNCHTEFELQIPTVAVHTYRLVMRAPAVPDAPPVT